MSNRMARDEVDHRTEVYACDNVAREVLEISNSESPDLIAITSSPNRSVERYFLPAYARDVITYSRFPVISVRDFEDAN